MLIRSAPGSQPVMPQIHRRARWLVTFVAVAFLVLLGRLWQLQLMRGEQYHQGAIENIVHERFLPSVRGKILDAEGRPLVDNRPAFNIYASPESLDDGALGRLAELLSLDDEEREGMFQRRDEAVERDTKRAVLLLEDQGRDRAALVAQARQALPGISVHDEPYRRYVHGSVAAHVVGYMNHLTAAELAEYGPQGYDSSEYIGRYGLERQWEHYLRGKKGIERYVVDATGKRVEGEDSAALIEGETFVPPVAGHNLVLTLDLDMQRIAEKAVRWHSAAAIVVLEVRTGRILAMVSKPSFDPNVMTGHLTRALERALSSDPRKPFIDKVMRTHYPPGSTFKPVTMIAARESKLVDGSEQRECKGRIQRGRQWFRCPGGAGHGKKVDMIHALKHSCNVYVWELAEQIGLDGLAEVARDLGYGQPTGLGLNGDVSGRVPTREWYESRDGFKIGYTLNAATGQGDVEATVLQVALAYAALANGGNLYVPQIVRRIESASGEVIAEYEPVLRRRINVSSETLALLQEGMWAVVNEVGGTAHDAASDLLEFSGKTGTAQVLGRRRKRQQGIVEEKDGWDPYRNHAWFAGYAPSADPEIAVVVLIEHGGAGGHVAGPVAKEIIEGWYNEVRNP